MGRRRNKHSQKKCSENNIKTAEEVTVKDSTNSLHHSTCVDDSVVEAKVPCEEEVSCNCELAFKKYHPSSSRVQGREYFVHSLCQMCKRELSERILCRKCSLVGYCSEDHRRLHWPEHAELCAAVQAVCRSRGEAHILQSALHLQPEAFRVLRCRNMQDCEAQAQRPLESWEKEVFIFPNVCGTCHQHKTDSLVICERCNHSGFCEGHREENHDEWCSHLMLYKRLVRDQNKHGIICPALPICRIYQSLPKLTNINDAFKDIRSIINELEFLELTEIVTYPLTALNAVLQINSSQILSSDKLVLHIVGAEREFEGNKLEKWEHYVLHLMPRLKSLTVEFIGPELNVGAEPKSYKVCRECLTAKKSINFRYENQLYHNLTKNPNFSKPNLVCVFNPGLYRTTGFDGQDTWSPSIASMFSQKCPVVTTSYTKKEVYLDVDRVKVVQNVELLKEPSPNPFSSLKPSLNFVSDEDSPVIFKNQFYSVMTHA